LNEILYTRTYQIQGRDFEHGGEASSDIKEALKKMGLNSQVVKRTAIASYEAEMNIIVYAENGELILEVFPHMVKVTAIDRGPGIEDVELAMKEGYSTAPPEIREMGFGSGMGLPNIKRNADRLVIESIPGKGTKVTFEIDIPNAVL
jgi:anti-sigma regulatory factor (Ser/Thr protein kinase)